MTLNRRVLRPGERIRVLVVDDSVVIRRLVSHALEQDPLIEVVGFAANGLLALQRIEQLNPDVLTLDIEMPEMDGLELLRRLRGQYSQLRVIMFSTLTERAAAITLEALTLGADDYVTKVSNEGSLDRSLDRLRQELLPKIKQFFCEPTTPSSPVPVAAPKSMVAHIPAGRPRVVVLGVSTGGPTALGGILPDLPSSFPLPVLVVQHMPPLFTRFLAERLDAICRLAVREAIDGEPVVSGKVFLAPGDFHMRLEKTASGVHIRLDQSPPENSCRPAVDALFMSAGEVYGGSAVAAILTGMGQDGLRGARVLKAHGAQILAQDEESSVVWGMPRAIVEAGLADRVLPLRRIVPEILHLAGSA